MHQQPFVGCRLCPDPLGSSQRSHCWIWKGNRKNTTGRDVKGRRTEKEGNRTEDFPTVLFFSHLQPCIVIVLVYLSDAMVLGTQIIPVTVDELQVLVLVYSEVSGTCQVLALVLALKSFRSLSFVACPGPCDLILLLLLLIIIIFVHYSYSQTLQPNQHLSRRTALIQQNTKHNKYYIQIQALGSPQCRILINTNRDNEYARILNTG